MSNYKIQKVRIDHFRGYKDEIAFDLTEGSDLTILQGPNGYGKTSFFDAIEWAFTGRLLRYEDPDEDKYNCNIINFQPFEKRASVTIEFGNGDSKYILCRKSTRDYADYGPDKTLVTISGSNITSELKGKDVDDFLNNILISYQYKNDICFKDAFNRYNILTQDKMKNFIQGMKGTDRYAAINTLIGNEKFLRYKDIFNKWVRNLRLNYNTLLEKRKNLCKELNWLEEMVKSAPTFNVGKFDNLIDYIEGLINQYNKISKNMCQFDNFSCFDVPEESISLNNKVKILAEHILKQKNKLIEYINTVSKQEENIENITLEKDNYKLNCKKIEKLNALKELSQIYKELDYCRNKVELWTGYESKKKELENKIRWITERNEMILYMQAQLNKIINTINDMLLFEGLSTDFDILETEEKINKLIDWCSSEVVLHILCDEMEIEICLFSDEILKINELMLKVDNLHNLPKRRIMLNYELKNYTVQLKDKAESLLEKLKYIIDRYTTNQSIREQIEKDIKQLNEQDKELKQILMEMLKYLEEHSNDNMQLCPVCRTPFSKEELLKRVRDQIVSENDIANEKIRTLTDIDIVIKKDLEEIKDYKNIYDKSVDEYKNSLMNINKYVSYILNVLRNEKDRLSIEKQKANDELELLLHENKKLEAYIKKHAINMETKSPEEQIEKKLNNVIENILQLGFPKEAIYYDDIEEIISKTKYEILQYENKLQKYNIDKYKLDEDIQKMMYNLSTNLLTLKTYEDKLELIEKKVVEIQSFLDTNEKIKRIENLKDENIKLYDQIKELEKTIENVEKLSEASKTAAEELVKEVLNKYAYNINKIYKRIYSHPRFKEFDFELDRTRKDNSKLNLLCYDNNIEINPAYIFSSAQVNALALSIFLGMAFSHKCTLLDTILMDDPIQNLDDFNVFAFIDILRSSLNEGMVTTLKKQLIISTHDEMVYRLMRKKFRFYNFDSYIFRDYNENGPVVLHMHDNRNVKYDRVM